VCTETVQEEFSALTKNMLVQELDHSLTLQRNLATVAQKLDSEVALLERSGATGSVPPSTSTAPSTAPTKSPRRRRGGSKRDQQKSNKVTNLARPLVNEEVIVSTPDQRTCVVSSLPLHSMPSMNTLGFVPPFTAVHPSHTVSGIRTGLVMTPNSTRMPSIRFVNGDDSPARFPKYGPHGTVGVAGLRLPRGRQDSSSSTDSAETVRHLEHGTCVGDVDRYLKASAMMQSIHQTCGTFAAPSSVSNAQGMRFYVRPALLSGVSFPASRSELEQYKQVVHGSSHIPPTDPSTMSTPKLRAARGQQRSPGRGRGRKSAASADRNVVPVVATSSTPRFFSVGLVPPSLSIPAVRGVTQPSVATMHGILIVVCVEVDKRLCYCRGTARRATSVEILWPFFD